MKKFVRNLDLVKVGGCVFAVLGTAGYLLGNYWNGIAAASALVVVGWMAKRYVS